MQLTRPLVASLAALLFTPAFGAESVTFQKNAFPVGTKRTVTRHDVMNMTMDMMGQQMAFKMVGDAEIQDEVLSATQVRIMVKKDVQNMETPFGPQNQESGTHGKTFLAEMKDGKILVTDAEGKPVAAGSEEQEKVSRHAKDLLQAGVLGDKLSATPIEVGKAIELSAEEVGSLFDMDDEDQAGLKSFKMTLTGQQDVGGRTCGVFSIEANVAMAPGENAPGEMQIKMTGEAYVCVQTCRWVGAEMKGPLSMEVEEQGMKMTATGDMSTVLKTRF